MKKNSKLFLILFTLFILLVRLSQITYVAEDYTLFLQRWIIFIRTNGYFFAFKESFSNYNYPYLYFLVLFSYFRNPLILIKLLSLLGDFGLSFMGSKIVQKCLGKSEKSKKAALWTYVVLFASPVVMCNSTFWGQCDSIYSFFVVCSIYFLMNEKVIRSFLFLGIAFAFKLQAIFILPVFIILLFCNKKIKFYYFFLIPIVNFILCLPATLFGGSLLYTYDTYFNQVDKNIITRNSLNFYQFFEENQHIQYGGFAVTVSIFAVLFFLFVLNKQKFSPKRILSLSLLSVSICFFFLPCMHERYSYLADIFSIIWIFTVDKKKAFVPFIMNLCSYITYICYFVANEELLPAICGKTLAILYVFAIIIVLSETCKPLIKQVYRKDFFDSLKLKFRKEKMALFSYF